MMYNLSGWKFFLNYLILNGLNATGLRLGEILDSKINLDLSYSSLSKLRYSGLKHSLAYCPKDTDSYLSLIDKKARDHIIIIEDKLNASSFNELAKIIRKAAFINTIYQSYASLAVPLITSIAIVLANKF